VAHWDAGIVVNLLGLAVLLAIAAWLRNRIGPLRRLAVPDALVAGTIGLLAGPHVLDVAPLSSDDLELVVYHGFAVVFIAVALQAPPPGRRSGGAKSMTVMVPTMAIAQVLVGFAAVAVLNGFASDTPAGFGFLPMLGFSQGPGQALSIAGSWELADGGQLGLVFAAIGFAFCCVLGVPLIYLGRKWGWVDTKGFGDAEQVDTPSNAPPPSVAPAGMEPLTAMVVAIGCIYAAGACVVWGLTALLPEGHPIAPTLWGFHFIAGALVAITVRRVAIALKVDRIFDDAMLARISVIAVDFTTTAALAGVALGVLGRWLIPIAVLCIATAAVTLLLSVWLSRRVFPDRPFEHAVAVYGTSTGTLPTGLALLRILDPGLRGPVARNLALGATGAVPITAPLMLGVLPFAVSLWDQGLAVSLGLPAAMLVAYLGALALAWKWMTPAQLLRPLRRLWPR
jgi:ESS family glutamate:Na+ symporter